MEKIGLIGGSGFYELKRELQIEHVETPFGTAEVGLTKIGNKEVTFLARHGRNHSIPPHLINYKANIYALYKLGVDRIISTSAVGSLLPDFPPGSFVLPEQFVDFTTNRPKSFFDGNFSITLHSGKTLKGVVHTDFSAPYCPDIRSTILAASKKVKAPIHNGGVYICTNGPRFETPAEIAAFRALGATVVGMTSVTECILARELGMCYATLCLVTNLAAGLQDRITIDEVFAIFEQKTPLLKAILETTIPSLAPSQKSCTCNPYQP